MFGTIINTAGIVAGGIVGGLFGRLLKEQHQKSLTMAVVSAFCSSVYPVGCRGCLG